MQKGLLAALAGLFSLVTLSAAQANDGYQPDTTHMTLDAGVAGGGDKLATVEFTDGSSKTLYAGNGLYVDFGAQHNFAGSDWSFRGTLGVDTEVVSASNATTTFTRTPLDLLAIYNHGNNHFGFGITEHFSPKLDMDGYAPNVDFDNATGFIVQYQYWLFGIRYTNIKYTASTLSTPAGSGSCTGNCSFDGSSIGVFFNYVF